MELTLLTLSADKVRHSPPRMGQHHQSCENLSALGLLTQPPVASFLAVFLVRVQKDGWRCNKYNIYLYIVTYNKLYATSTSKHEEIILN